MTTRRVLVTGVGTVSPLAPDTPGLWDGLLAGRSSARVLDAPWAADLPVRIAAPLATDPADLVGSRRARSLDRVQQMALGAAREAWADAGAPDVERERLAVVVGSGVGGVLSLFGQYDRFRDDGAHAVSPYGITMFMPNGSAAAVGLELGARGGVHTPVSACASGAEAVALGLDLIRAGRADVVVAGGTEAPIHPLPLAGFAAMRALSRRHDEPHAASRPFDKNRDGFVLGEGAAVVVLESAAHAAARGSRAYAELAGAGLSSDAHHVVAPDPTGSGGLRAMGAALRDAGACPGDVVHVNAHATSTPLGDAAESAALRALLGEHVADVPVSAVKAQTGHLLGAAGALTAVVSALSLRHGLAPWNPHLADADDAIGLDVVTHAPRPLRPGGVALANAFGFGGHNVALALRAA